MKKHIGFYFHSGLDKPGGAERVLTLIANKLSALGYIIYIITYTDFTPSYYPLSNKVERISLGFSNKRNPLSKVLVLLKLIFRLRKEVKLNRINNVVPLGTPAAIIVGLALLKMANLKKYIWIHYSFFKPLTYREVFFRRYIVPLFDKLIILNKTDTEKFSELFPNKVVYIPNPKSFTADTLSELNKNTIIALGRITTIKGFDELIEIFSLFKSKNNTTPWQLKIYGNDGGEKNNLQIKIHELNLQDSVFILDAVNDVKSVLSDADVYAMTSQTECMGMVLLEAQEMGLPIVCYDCNSGPRDIVTDGVDGFLIQQGSQKEFANALFQFIEHPELKYQFAKAAKKNVQQYHIDRIISKWQKIFEDEVV